MRPEHVSQRARFRPTLALCLFLVAATGCAGIAERERVEAAALLGAPDWVTQGCEGRADRICGVGAAAGVQNSSLRRTAAIGRARSDIARSLQSRVTSMLQDYAAARTDAEDAGLASSDPHYLIDVSKQITNVTLAETEVTATWVSRDATLYALVTLDVAKFCDTVSRMSQLSEELRQAVVERANETFADPDGKPARHQPASSGDPQR